MKWTIITPTLQRSSLVKACESVDSQGVDWEHLVMVDCEHLDEGLANKCWNEPRRRFFQCAPPHKNGGNTCRHKAYEFATGDYFFYLDDDNYLADHRVLADIEYALEFADLPAWAIFPIIRLGGRFFADPPRSCHTDTMNVVLRRDVALWPNTDAYGSDGLMVETLRERGIPYASFPHFRPIAVLPKISFCKEDE